MNSRRLVGNANSLLNITGVSRLKLQLTRIVWIVAHRADGRESVGVGKGQVSWLSELKTIANRLRKDRFADLAKAYGDFLPGEIVKNDNNRSQGGFQIYSPCCRFV
jgi:hypothetical protein